jgi:D-serine deaminase-like pyridoxal phosphate-dependent protein
MSDTLLSSLTPNYPLPSRSSLAAQFVGKKLQDLATPAIVLDRAPIRRNCDAMLNVCKELGVGFRAHVKSHKTLELSMLQVGGGGGGGQTTEKKEEAAANFIVSTIIEAENLADLVLEEQAKGRQASVRLFSFIFF